MLGQRPRTGQQAARRQAVAENCLAQRGIQPALQAFARLRRTERERNHQRRLLFARHIDLTWTNLFSALWINTLIHFKQRITSSAANDHLTS